MNLLTRRLTFAARRITGRVMIAPIKKALNRLRYSHLADPKKTLMINLSDIRYWYTGNRYDGITFPEEIRGGDWSDKLVPREERLENRSGYLGLIEHFRDGVPWKQTQLFQEKYRNLLSKRGEVKGCSNLDELEKHYTETYDTLYENIREHGLLPASPENPDIDPVYVHIGPEGELIYTVDGNHRLYIALILGIEQMPVRVWMRHARWQRTRDHILGRNGKDVDMDYQKFLGHPDIVSELK
jgi:hypothetical protein